VTILDEIIDASTDSTVSTPDLLRKVQIAATRLGASDIVTWAKQELAGYPDDAPLPEYRKFGTAVIGRFSGPFNSWIEHNLSGGPDILERLWRVEMRQPLLELQSLSEGDTDAERQWPMFAVREYEKSRALHVEGYGLWSVRNVISCQKLRGVVDVIRSKAMEFALELQMQFPDAGSVGGPTVNTTPELAQAISHITFNITGDGTNVATGHHITQTSTVNRGDVAALRREVAALGLGEQDVEAFVTALAETQSLEAPAVVTVLDRMRNGAITLGTAITTEAAAAALIELGKMFLGLN
jgi:hypothetical protein